MNQSIGSNDSKTREELERALTEIGDSEARYHVRQAMQLLEAEDTST
jgi:hypothetical protein